SRRISTTIPMSGRAAQYVSFPILRPTLSGTRWPKRTRLFSVRLILTSRPGGLTRTGGPSTGGFSSSATRPSASLVSAMIRGGLADRRFLSSASYNKFGADVRHYWTVWERLTIAAHGYIQYTPAGKETPFWSMARLGGEENFLYDQMTLRGYGSGRFLDDNEF